jgi:hypothetical protein
MGFKQVPSWHSHCNLDSSGMDEGEGFVHKLRKSLALILSVGVGLAPQISLALDVNSTATALRLSNTITGGFMPSNDPLFAQMVSQVASGNVSAAAATAANSKYFASYMARRLALQMMTPSLDASTGTDNDASAFLIAHFVGSAGITPSLSSIWSDNSTYLVNVGGTQTHAAALTPAQLAAVNWMTDLVKVAGQNAKAVNGNAVTTVAIPVKHVGGYVTLSDRANDNSFAQWGATAGTNLRMIEGIWQIATGLTLVDTMSSNALVQDVPKFIPQYDPNFFQGQGQAACIACHAGGMASLNHGYSTVADLFDFSATNGLTYIATPTTATRKSLGSDAAKRNGVNTCNLVNAPTTVCNPDSIGVDANQAWNVSTTWGPMGILTTMGWQGPTAGQGLNELGSALGQAGVIYKNFVRRVVNEICPLGDLTQADVSRIAAAANPFAMPKGSDDIRTIVAMVASHPSCL